VDTDGNLVNADAEQATRIGIARTRKKSSPARMPAARREPRPCGQERRPRDANGNRADTERRPPDANDGSVDADADRAA
jgi:hypothetical protein